MTAKKRIILDCDPGHDDAMAIILAASAISNLQIEAITTVSGNTEVEKNTINALKVCEIIGLHLPVAQGAGRPLIKKAEIAEEIHGKTGLDGPLLPENPARRPIEKHAVDLIVERVMQSNGDITLVATGPLTNVAMAIIKEPGVVSKIKEIVLMGGGTFGNWTPAAEFNIYVDAEAAKIVFESGLPITMFGLDVTHQALATQNVIKELSLIDNKVAVFVIELLDFFSGTYKNVFGFEAAPVHDACTIAYLIDPSVFTFKQARVDIETKGEFTYGMTVVDFSGENKNVQFAESLNKQAFWSLFKKALETYSGS